jgi:prevent-host-death family protein
MQVAIRELKSSLSRVLALAQGGEVIEVTSHNKPIARIVGIAPQADEGLRRLMASGVLSWNGAKPAFAPTLELLPGGKPIGQMVLEDRG